LALESGNFGTFDYNPLTGDLGWGDRTRQIWGLHPGEEIATLISKPFCNQCNTLYSTIAFSFKGTINVLS
jgi:hypothetical protein